MFNTMGIRDFFYKTVSVNIGCEAKNWLELFSWFTLLSVSLLISLC